MQKTPPPSHAYISENKYVARSIGLNFENALEIGLEIKHRKSIYLGLGIILFLWLGGLICDLERVPISEIVCVCVCVWSLYIARNLKLLIVFDCPLDWVVRKRE